MSRCITSKAYKIEDLKKKNNVKNTILLRRKHVEKIATRNSKLSKHLL